MMKLIYKIQMSEQFELGDLSHIHVKGTDDCIGYLGADNSAEIVDPHRRDTRVMRRELGRLYRSV